MPLIKDPQILKQRYIFFFTLFLCEVPHSLLIPFPVFSPQKLDSAHLFYPSLSLSRIIVLPQQTYHQKGKFVAIIGYSEFPWFVFIKI